MGEALERREREEKKGKRRESAQVRTGYEGKHQPGRGCGG